MKKSDPKKVFCFKSDQDTIDKARRKAYPKTLSSLIDQFLQKFNKGKSK